MILSGYSFRRPGHDRPLSGQPYSRGVRSTKKQRLHWPVRRGKNPTLRCWQGKRRGDHEVPTWRDLQYIKMSLMSRDILTFWLFRRPPDRPCLSCQNDNCYLTKCVDSDAHGQLSDAGPVGAIRRKSGAYNW